MTEVEPVDNDLFAALEQSEGIGALTSDLRSLTSSISRSELGGPLAAANKYRFSSKEWEGNA